MYTVTTRGDDMSFFCALMAYLFTQNIFIALIVYMIAEALEDD